MAGTKRPLRRPAIYYPGRNAPLSHDFIQSWARALQSQLAEHFDLHEHKRLMTGGYFGMVTLKPEALHVLQTIPHVDQVGGMAVAILVYLCDKRQGGTGFYRHRSTGIERQTANTLRAYEEAMRQEAPGKITKTYPGHDHPLFEEIGRVEARFNRLVAYNCNLLHSGQVDAEHLTDDPAIGRLTVNMFVAPA